MAKCEKILIAGFSGAGKTSLLQKLQETCPEKDWSFSDLDCLVLKNHKSQEIARLIEEHGWEKFRLWERQTLEGWLKDEGKGILSLGGGTLSPILYDLYKSGRKVRICYLHAPFETCWERLLLAGTEERPLVKLGKGELHRIYEERQNVFSQIPWILKNDKGSDLIQLAEEFWSESFRE